MAWPGTIKFTRERTCTVTQQETKELKEMKEKKKEKACQNAMREIKIEVVKKPPVSPKVENPQVVLDEVWPRRKRTDITALYH